MFWLIDDPLFSGQRLWPSPVCFRTGSMRMWTPPACGAIRGLCLPQNSFKSIWCIFSLAARVSSFLSVGEWWHSNKLMWCRSFKMSHLHNQLHRLRLLSIQTGSAHWDLEFCQSHGRLVHLTEVLGLETNRTREPRWPVHDEIQSLSWRSSKDWAFDELKSWPVQIPALWRCWVYFQWSETSAVDFQGRTTWMWSSQEPDKRKTDKCEVYLVVGAIRGELISLSSGRVRVWMLSWCWTSDGSSEGVKKHWPLGRRAALWLLMCRQSWHWSSHTISGGPWLWSGDINRRCFICIQRQNQYDPKVLCLRTDKTYGYQ